MASAISLDKFVPKTEWGGVGGTGVEQWGVGWWQCDVEWGHWAGEGRVRKGQECFCFERPLGVHKEKIWKDEYVEIFSLLPLEKCNLDRVKPEDSKPKKEDKEKNMLLPNPAYACEWVTSVCDFSKKKLLCVFLLHGQYRRGI